MSVRKRGTKWVADIYDPTKHRKVWVGTFATKGQARAAEAKAELQRGTLTTSETVDGFAGRWLELHPRAKESSNLGYKQAIGRLSDEFKGRKLHTLSRVEAREWALTNRWRVDAARAMFSDAIRDGLVSENPFAGLRLQQSRGRRDLQVITEDQVEGVAGMARKLWGPGYEALIVTAAYVGLRAGELFGLRWDQVHLKDDELDVTRSFSSRSRTYSKPKNGQDRRIVLLPQAKEKLAALSRGDGALVFRTVRDRPMTASGWFHYWNPVRRACGLPEMALHELRHFCASYMLNDLGLAPHVVAHQLGHTDGGVLVAQLYGHPSESLAREQIKRAAGSSVRHLNPVREQQA